MKQNKKEKKVSTNKEIESKRKKRKIKRNKGRKKNEIKRTKGNKKKKKKL